MRLWLVAVLALTLLNGCGLAQHYQDPPLTEPFATLITFPTKGTASNYFVVCDNPDCKWTQGMGYFSGFSRFSADDASSVHRVRGGVRIYLSGYWITTTGVQVAAGTIEVFHNNYRHLASFVPQAGREYKVLPICCHIEIIDNQTGVPPESLQFHKIPTAKKTSEPER
jgi:hypothetical protein